MLNGIVILIVNEDGVHNLIWTEPASIAKIVDPDARLLPFADAQRAIVDQIQYKKSFLVDDVRSVRAEMLNLKLYLGYIGTADQDNQASAVPIWVYEVRDYWTFADGQNNVEANTETYAINALDGTPVDVMTQDWATTLMQPGNV